MKIVDLVDYFKDTENKKFHSFLNEVAGYVMYEQAMIKKDNLDYNDSTIKYRFDQKSYDYINNFISEIVFESKPVVGNGKKVIIKGMPEELMDEAKHQMSFSDKLYILDKIKDTFMHIRDEGTMYEFDFSDGCIVLKNSASDYSLDCRIPLTALYKLNRFMKDDYDKSSSTLDWVKDYLDNGLTLSSRDRDFNYKDYNLRLNGMVRLPGNRVVYRKGDEYLFFKKNNDDLFDTKFNFVSMSSYESYHTASYVASLISSMEDANYPFLQELYSFDLSCNNEDFDKKALAILSKIESFYQDTYSKIQYLSPTKVRENVKDFICSVNSQNNKLEGILVDMSEIHNRIIKKFIRNARSHANLNEEKDSDFGNPTIIYHDVSFNSYLNGDSEKSVPSFVMVGSKLEFDSLFDEVINNSKSNEQIYNRLCREFDAGNNDILEVILYQLEGFINFLLNAKASDYKYTKFNYLNTSVGNASNFVDFLRKCVNGTFEYEEGKGIGQR